MKICFTGDLFLGGDLLNKSCVNLVNSSVFNDADIRIVNLEQPISNSFHLEDKFTLYTGSQATQQLKELKIAAVNLAHNHIQDKGTEAISETVAHLQSAGIAHFGAGDNISKAGQPFWLTDKLAVFGYCDYDKPYLNKVVVAKGGQPGINPLRLEKIEADLATLPSNKKAILYFHWGREHVWLPPVDNIQLAKKLLENDRVETIIGMHAHRIQGVIRHSGKMAFMCLGNFVFPNFYIAPPGHISYPSEELKSEVRFQTRQYHTVFNLTYKKWRLVNRVSLIVNICANTNRVTHEFAIQDDLSSRVESLSGFKLRIFRLWFELLSTLYKLPKSIYSVLYKIHVLEVKLTWRLQIMWFYLKQLGPKNFAKLVIGYVKKQSK